MFSSKLCWDWGSTAPPQMQTNCGEITEKYDLNKIVYSDIFANAKKQKKVTEVFIKILDIRDSVLEEDKSI